MHPVSKIQAPRRRARLRSKLEQRLNLASRRENIGTDLQAADYVGLAIVTVLVPAVLMTIGWYL